MQKRTFDKLLLKTVILAGVLLSGANAENLKQTLYYGGDIVTMEGDKPEYVEALVQTEGKIAFLGSKDEAMKKYANAKRQDLKGKTLLPGFVDAHAHFYAFGVQAIGANLLAEPDGKVKNIDDVVSTLKEWAKGDDLNRTGWIFGLGYDDAMLEEGRHPTKEDLDKVSKEIPVMVTHISGHFCVLNSAGLKQSGITAESKDPKGGKIRRMAGSQEPNGVLEELAAIPLMMKSIYPHSKDNIKYFLKKSEETAMKYGITTAQEGRAMGNHEDMMMYAQEEGFKIDVVSYLDYSMKNNVKGMTCAGSGHHEKSGEDYTRMKTPWVGKTYTNGYRVGGMKITLDGSPQGRTAWRTKPYILPPDGQKEGYMGYPAFADDKELEALYGLAFKHDWQVLTHMNGDAAVDQFIRTIGVAAKKYGNDDRRSVLIHGVLMRKDQIDALKALKVIPSMYTMHTFYWGDWYKKIIGEDAAQLIAPAKTFIDKGFNLTIHTDAPVALPNQMTIVSASVNRTSRSGTVMGADERITAYQAMQGITINSAYQSFEEKKKGSLKVGKIADLVVLDANPLKVDPMKIKEITVLETIKNGKTIYTK
jgi:predicted amidohydrolase YtcJ